MGDSTPVWEEIFASSRTLSKQLRTPDFAIVTASIVTQSNSSTRLPPEPQTVTRHAPSEPKAYSTSSVCRSLDKSACQHAAGVRA